MRAHLGENNDDDFSQLLKLREGKILCSSTNGTEVHLDNRLGRIVYSLAHFIDTIYPDIENLL